MKEIIFAFLLSLFNFLSGILVYKFIIDKSNKIFYRVFLGSIFFRYVINLFFLFFFLKYLKFEQLKFALAYLIGTFLAILLEVLSINKMSNFLNLQFKQNSNFKKIENGE